MKAKRLRLCLATLTLLPISIVRAEIPTNIGAFSNLSPSAIDYRPMKSIPGASVAVLVGHPGREGLYIMRYRLPANTLMAAHYNDQDRHITVISGTWAFGKGVSMDCSQTTAMPPGSYIYHPAGAAHFDGSCSDQSVEIQVTGMGPVQNFIAR